MIDYANTLLSLIQSAACSARVQAGADRGKCVHITQLTHYQIVYLSFGVLAFHEANVPSRTEIKLYKNFQTGFKCQSNV